VPLILGAVGPVRAATKAGADLMLVRGTDYDDTVARFRWRVPDRYNIGADIIDRHADGSERLALTVVEADGSASRYSFDRIKSLSNALANVFLGHGAVPTRDGRPGDRVAILLSQSLETALAHVAAYKAGLIALPLFTLFGPDALHYRLSDSGAGILVTDRDNWPKIEAIRDTLAPFKLILIVDRPDAPAKPLPPGTTGFHAALTAAAAPGAAVRMARDLAGHTRVVAVQPRPNRSDE
jgi:acetyl-CoA synthetase